MTFHAKPASPEEMTFIQEVLSNGGALSEAYSIAFPDFKGSTAERTKLAGALARRKVVAQALGRIAAKQQRVLLDAVDRAAVKYGITAETAADQLARLCYTPLREFVDVRTVDGVQQLIVHDFDKVSADAHMALHKVRQTREGISVELADKIAAIRTLAQLKGWIKEDKAAGPQQVVLFKVEK